MRSWSSRTGGHVSSAGARGMRCHAPIGFMTQRPSTVVLKLGSHVEEVRYYAVLAAKTWIIGTWRRMIPGTHRRRRNLISSATERSQCKTYGTQHTQRNRTQDTKHHNSQHNTHNQTRTKNPRPPTSLSPAGWSYRYVCFIPRGSPTPPDPLGGLGDASPAVPRIVPRTCDARERKMSKTPPRRSL